jgi:hypothetical protein
MAMVVNVYGMHCCCLAVNVHCRRVKARKIDLTLFSSTSTCRVLLDWLDQPRLTEVSTHAILCTVLWKQSRAFFRFIGIVRYLGTVWIDTYIVRTGS